MTHSSPANADTIPLADHDEIGRKVLTQPWDIQKAIVTITAHCTALVDEHPTGPVADLAGCISQGCLELADALNLIRAQQMPSRETLANAILKAEIDHPRKLPGEKRSLGYYVSVGLDAFSHPHDALGRLALAAAEACLSAFTSPGCKS